MKKLSKKVIAFALAVVMTLTAGAVAPQGNVEVQAASGRVYVNPYSATVVTYKPGKDVNTFTSTISIMGCDKAKEIKKLKSSNKNIRVAARDGYIRVEFGKKAAKSTITCTVKGVKLKTTFTVKKYTNPCKTFKIGKTNLLSKFNKNDVLRTNKAFKKQKLDIKLKSGWKISSVHVTSGTGSYNNYRVNKSVSLRRSQCQTIMDTYMCIAIMKKRRFLNVCRLIHLQDTKIEKKNRKPDLAYGSFFSKIHC